MNARKFVTRTLTMTVDPGASGFMDALNDACVADIRDLENVSIILNQIVDGGTATLSPFVSYDGVNYVPQATKADTNFAAGANQAILAATLSDANGMALKAQSVKVVLSAYTAGGTYTATVTGIQSEGFR